MSGPTGVTVNVPVDVSARGPAGASARRQVSAAGLVDALDLLIADGVAVSGDVVIGVAGVDLIRLDLRLLLAGADAVVAPVGEAAR